MRDKKRKPFKKAARLSRRALGAAALAAAGAAAAKPLAKTGVAAPVSLVEADHYEKLDEDDNGNIE